MSIVAWEDMLSWRECSLLCQRLWSVSLRAVPLAAAVLEEEEARQLLDPCRATAEAVEAQALHLQSLLSE